MTNPKVSLIVVYHNEETTLQECVKSFLNQSFKDFELICVNNGSTDSSEKIVLELVQDNDNVKKMSLPSEVTLKEAQNSALGLASGDFVCFLDSSKRIEEGFVANLFAQVFCMKNNAITIIQEKMYKREFLENIDMVDSIIENKIGAQSDKLKEIVSGYENFIKTELDKNAKSNIENVNNKVYDVVCRFNQLEKNMYDRAGYYETMLNDKTSEMQSAQEGTTAQIYNDISKIYEFVGSEVNQKGSEISRVYEEITKNYKYTETLVEQAKENLSNQFGNEGNYIKEKLENLEKEIAVRNVALKRLIDMQLDELDSKIKALGGSQKNSDYEQAFNVVETSKIVEENVEKMYEHINKTNAQFYEELTGIYKELNSKLVEKMQEQQVSFDKKIDDLRSEFNQKIEAFKGN